VNTQPFPQAIAPQTEQPLRALDRPAQPLTVAEALTLPALCGPAEIQKLWHIGKSRFAILNKQGAFDFLKAEHPVGPRCFSGVLIGRYLRKEPLYEPSFGGKGRR